MATIAENLQTIIDIKADIKTAIENKGVTVGDAGFGEYAGKIDEISGGSGSSWTLPDNTKFANGPTTYPELHFTHLTNCNSMFYKCSNLTSVPLFDTSNVTNMSYMFQYCSNLTTVPSFDTSKVTGMSDMFGSCVVLTTIPEFNTDCVTHMDEMFKACLKLTTVPLLNCSQVKNVQGMFDSCEALKYVAGFTNLGQAFSLHASDGAWQTLDLTSTKVLTSTSMRNIFNSIYDFGDTSIATTGPRQIKLNYFAYPQDNDVAIATSKGWTITII